MLNIRLTNLRNSRNKTQQDIADYLGLTRPAYTAYERGTRHPDYSTLQKLADYYGVTTDYLLGRTDNMNGWVNVDLMKSFAAMLNRRNELDVIKTNRALTENEISEHKMISTYLHGGSYGIDIDPIKLWEELCKRNKKFELENNLNVISVAGQEINLTEEELILFNELKKHPIMLHDLASDPEQKVKELIKLYKMKKMFLEDDDEERGDGFGELED